MTYHFIFRGYERLVHYAFDMSGNIQKNIKKPTILIILLMQVSLSCMEKHISYYKILVSSSYKALEAVSDSVCQNGCPVRLWEYHGLKSQEWALIEIEKKCYKILNRTSGKCLDAHATNTHENGCGVQLYDYVGQENQKWIIEPLNNGYCLILNKTSNKALDAWIAQSGEDGCGELGSNLNTLHIYRASLC